MNRIELKDAYAKWSDELVGYATVLVGADAADDVVADTFVTLIHREREDAEQPGPTRWQAVKEPRGYLFRSVSNTAKMRHRSSNRRHSREVVAASLRTRSGRAADALLADPLVLAAVGSLSVQQRAAIFLTYWADLPIGEVAQVLDCRNGTAKRHLARARATLRNALDRKDSR